MVSGGASTDGTKAVNLIVGDSVETVKEWLESLVSQFSTGEYFEADAKNAVDLPS